ncbi:DUF4179 domain-containing protein [Bacillus massiliigorillae]|uniref:DUF4179 domain-containing protein n=1 Tax=Bacillus massiliigorillae TaxID=1243664 RepID=UPI0003A571DF|nr:DUF4179 domain-containing protein [Bacillus massiliigorillae]
MTEREETKLNEAREAFEQIPIPTIKIDEAIQNGYVKARTQKRKKRSMWLFSSLTAALLLLGLTTLLFTSPTFAAYVSKIPGMENFVHRIHDDKGIISAVENDYLEKIDITQKKKGIALTIDSVMKDENGLVIFYSAVSDQDREEISLRDIKLSEKYGPYSSGSTSLLHVKQGERNYEKAEIYFEYPMSRKDFTVAMTLESKDYSEQFTFSFSLKKAVAEKKTFKVNKTVQIAGQNVIVKSISIQPIRTDIYLAFDPNNEKKILELSDFRLVDENGETWSSIQNGVTGSGWENDEGHYYLQSNYFKEPKELYLVMNKAQALNRNQTQIVIDTEKQSILKAPDQSIKSLQVMGNELTFSIQAEKDFHHGMFGTVKDANGKELQVESSSMSSIDNKSRSFGVVLKANQSFSNPLTIDVLYYPAWINGNVKVRVK